MKRTCEKCGKDELAIFVWSGLCADCWFVAHEERPATVLPAVNLTAGECTFCGREVMHRELCSDCDPWIKT